MGADGPQHLANGLVFCPPRETRAVTQMKVSKTWDHLLSVSSELAQNSAFLGQSTPEKEEKLRMLGTSHQN